MAAVFGRVMEHWIKYSTLMTFILVFRQSDVSGYCMTTLKFTIIFLLIGFCSCGQTTPRQKVDPAAVQLANKIIPLTNHLNNQDSCRKALAILDSATTIDRNCFLCYHNKLMFLNSLKQFGRAIETINECIRIKPMAHDLYLTGGVLYERVGDTVSSAAYFKKSLAICSNVLDTMSIKNRNYEIFVGSKAVNLIMLGDTTAANVLLRNLYNSQTDKELKKMTLSMMHKDKEQLLQLWTSD